MLKLSKIMLLCLLVSLCLAIVAVAQDAPAAGGRAGGMGGMGGRGGMGRGGAAPAVVSTEILSDKQVTFRISAPQVTNVTFASSDIFNLGEKAQMKKSESGVWETTVGPLEPGAYRYNFTVNGVQVVDPQSSSISESNTRVQSLLIVPGSEYMDTKDVPRGAVAEITYYSKSLARFRRMHVYTPPGYETNQQKYPIFYLLHGAMDNDDSWTTIGRAGFILDNMIAAGKVKPMVVVMPAGHTNTSNSMGGLRRGAAPSGSQPSDEFSRDFINDIMPYAETHYRVLTDHPHRAMAGLSMGGMQTHSIAMANLDKFSHIGLFSGSTISADEITDVAGFKEKVKVLFMSCGSKESPSGLQTSHDALEKLGIKSTTFVQPDAQHEWRVWRASLIQFAPLLFQD
jgi:enterochelin esterase-like enzyme